jgi:hypothetical protein
VLDELEIHQIPVLFDRGRRLFENSSSHLELEIVRVIDSPRRRTSTTPYVAELVDQQRLSKLLPTAYFDWSIS